MAAFDLVLLGTGSPIPDPDRAGPASLVRTATTRLLVDAGRAVVLRLAGAGVAPPMLDAILITHLHSDHVCALNDVVTTTWVTAPVPRPIRIYGPPGTRHFVGAMMDMLGPDIGYRIAHHDDLVDPPEIVVEELEPNATFTIGDVAVTVGRTDHRPVEPTIGYRLEHDGRAVVLGGDGVPCGSLDELCAGADVYVQTVVRDDLIRPVGFPRFVDILDYHSTVTDASRTATKAGVGTLVLTHMVPPPTTDTVDEWQAIAAQDFAGPIIVGADGQVVAIA
ncbi:MAG: MBL fold metallo-hydrolase [Actinobacteria bacterium]|nr:MBL fold metallo-hydrolase [Actinomycetota bacterium]